MSGMGFEIGGRRIGPGQPPYVIAELSANHGQELERALELVGLAADAGADAVKLQTYTPDTITLASDKPWFRIESGTRWDGRTLHDLYAEAYTPWEWHAQLKAAAEARGMHLFSSPFDATAVELLESLEVPAYKIASFEIVVDSPPGIASASTPASSWGVRTSTGDAPISANTRACSRKSPWRARTPAFTAP